MARDERCKLAVPPLLPLCPKAPTTTLVPHFPFGKGINGWVGNGDRPRPNLLGLGVPNGSVGGSGRIFGGVRRDAFTVSSLAGRGCASYSFPSSPVFSIEKSIEQVSKKSTGKGKFGDGFTCIGKDNLLARDAHLEEGVYERLIVGVPFNDDQVAFQADN